MERLRRVAALDLMAFESRSHWGSVLERARSWATVLWTWLEERSQLGRALERARRVVTLEFADWRFWMVLTFEAS